MAETKQDKKGNHDHLKGLMGHKKEGDYKPVEAKPTGKEIAKKEDILPAVNEGYKMPAYEQKFREGGYISPVNLGRLQERGLNQQQFKEFELMLGKKQELFVRQLDVFMEGKYAALDQQLVLQKEQLENFGNIQRANIGYEMDAAMADLNSRRIQDGTARNINRRQAQGNQVRQAYSPMAILSN